ncbi:MAG: DUF4101 domain-containing protein [Stenomitos rutilans HA7619-LM2]|jgi:hypothetical protein|nr:DUF4101 domain-containing protein [Stenomitos rutilans HA7619-LM2]
MSEESSEVPQQSSQSAANHISAGGNVSIGNITLISSAENLSRVNLPNAITCKDSSTFIGREQELEFLWGSLEKHRLAIISGMYGSGKTELAKQFIRQYGSACLGGIFWADGNSLTEQIANSFFTHRKNFQKDFIFLLVWDDISIREHKVLLKTWQTQFDGNLYVLVTTREHQEGNFVCPLGGLSFEESLQLLEAFTGNNRVSSARFSRQYGVEERLIEKLGHLQLAIEAIGKFLSYNSKLSLRDFLEQIEHAGLSHPALIEEVRIPLEGFWGKLSESSQVVVCKVGLFPNGASKKMVCKLSSSSGFAVFSVELLCRFNLASKTKYKAETHFTVNPIAKLFLEEKLTEYEDPNEIVEEVIQVLLEEARNARVYWTSKSLCEDAIRIANQWSLRACQVTALQALANLTLRTAFKETNNLSRRDYLISRRYYESEYLLNSSKEYYFQAEEILAQCEDEFPSYWYICSLKLFVFLFRNTPFEWVLLQFFKVVRFFVGLWKNGRAATKFVIVIAVIYLLLQHYDKIDKLVKDIWSNNLEEDTRKGLDDPYLETPLPSPNIQVSPEAPKTLSLEGAHTLIWSYLEAKKKIYSSPYDEKKIEDLAGGKFVEEIKKNLEIYKKNEVSLSSYKNLGFNKKDFSCDKGICVFVVEVKRMRVEQGNKNPKRKTTCLEQGIFKYTLQNENGKWKIYDQKEVTSTTDDFRWRSKTSGGKTKHC